MKFFLIFFCFWSAPAFHGGHVAEHHYQLNRQNLSLKFSIERVELMHFNFKDDCDYLNMTALCTAQYLNRNSFIHLNDEPVEMELESAYTDGDKLVVLLGGVWECGTINKVHVENKCFYEFDSKFKNRIVMDIGDFQKSYLLNINQDRLMIE